jgi:hypothetical protein
LFQHIGNGKLQVFPPGIGMLFGPADFRGSKWDMLFGGRGNQAALFVNDEGASAASSDVNAEYVNG